MFLKIENLKKSFAATDVLKACSFNLEKGTTLSILGKSGCGKTTLLKIIAGLLEPDAGQIFLENKNIILLSPQKRGVVYLYQEPLLFPHLNVFENVSFGLKLQNQDAAIIKKKTTEMLEELELTNQTKKMPQQLSGGQRQRVAFGRALIIEPKLLLLDEPFGALDVETRATMQIFYKKIAQKQRISSVFVTHDLKEAVLMGNTWGFMENGQLKIYDTLSDFIADEKTGMKREIEFWKKI